MKPLTAEEYAREWASIEALVFSGRPADGHPFRPRNWKMVLLVGGLCLTDVDFAALRDTALQFADRETVIVARDPTQLDHTPGLLPWERPAFHSAGRHAAFGHGCAHVFAQSAMWGIAAMSHESYAVLGGTATFVEEFVDRAGGEARVKGRFLDATVDGDIGGFGERGHRYAKDLLHMVQWISHAA